MFHQKEMIRSVLFDLDRTLLDRDSSVSSFARSQYERFRPRLNGIQRDDFVGTFIRLDARGSVWKDLVYQRMVGELPISSVTAEELFADFDANIADHYIPFPNLHRTLDELSGKYRLGLITNGKTHFQNRTIEKLAIRAYFPVILISEAEGVRKPDAEIFHRALRLLKVLPNEAVYIGDHPIWDIQAAHDAGLFAFWKRNADFSEMPCDGIIDDLGEIKDLLR